MATNPTPGITVYTTTGNTYAVPGAAVPPETGVTATGELTVLASAPADSNGSQPWLAEFGSVEAVWAGDAVVQSSPAASRGGGL
jgi:hypothetical protein